MKSSFIYFKDQFLLLISQRLEHAQAPSYEYFRTSIFPQSKETSLFVCRSCLFEAWRLQLPTHQIQHLALQSSQVSEDYCEFLIHEFDDWFASVSTSESSLGSFFYIAFLFLNIIIAATKTICFFTIVWYFAMIALIFVVILFFLFPFFFPGSYVAELMMSFLPYLVGLSVFFLVLSFVNLRKNMKPGNKRPALPYFRGVAFLVFCSLFFIWSKQFNNFYTTPLPEQASDSGSLHVLFANLQKDNTKYTELEDFISQEDPDLLMFVEFADHHYDHLKDFLKTYYPYTNNISRSTTFVGSMVFSKYPINNKADDFPQGAWRYGYFSLNYQGEDMYFYLVHTSSPDSYSHFVMRNEQLQTFVDDFQIHKTKNKHENVVVAGDFNITPWSSYYDILHDVFSGEMINVTTHIPFLFTRKLFALPLIQAHIDHLWTTPTLRIPSIEKVNIPGSDHKGFLFDITYLDR